MSSSERHQVPALLELVEAQHQVIERLQSALADAERANADRHALRRMLAHELRTPLAAVIGALHTLALPELPEAKATELRERALRQAMHLNEMIDDILALSDPHEPWVDRMAQEWVELRQVVKDVCLAVAAEVPPERLTVPTVPAGSIRTVPSRLRQILVNLIVNAAKYSPPGSPIRLRVRRLDDGVEFEVADRGPGIAPDQVDVLCRPFTRGNHEGIQGLGLGLFLVRALVRSLGGHLELANGERGGTVARVWLPQQRQSDTTPPRPRLRVVEGAHEEG